MNELRNGLVDLPDTMSSLEIAELTGKRHTTVREDIERILYEVEIDLQEFLQVEINQLGQKVKIYKLPRRECDLVVSGYSAKYRLAIIDRWLELENPKQLTGLEILLGHAQKAVELEREFIKQKGIVIGLGQHLEETDTKVEKLDVRVDYLESRKPTPAPEGFTYLKPFWEKSSLVLSVDIMKWAANEYNVAKKFDMVFNPEFGDNQHITFYHKEQLHRAYLSWISDSNQTSPKKCTHKSGKTFKYLKD